jgi:hypothetical protein
MNDSNNIQKTDFEHDTLFKRVAELIETVRLTVSTTVNLGMVHTYFEIGKMIIEDEQKGKKRAEYGKSVLKELSANLTTKFGKGFSVENLECVFGFNFVNSVDEIESLFCNKSYMNGLRNLTKLFTINNQKKLIWLIQNHPCFGFM